MFSSPIVWILFAVLTILIVKRDVDQKNAQTRADDNYVYVVHARKDK